MTNIQEIKTLDDLSEQYSIWIVKYYSKAFEKPLFLIFYRENDEDETGKILTYKNGDIFTFKIINELKKKLKSNENELISFENINTWLKSIEKYKIVESCTFDLNSVITNLEGNIMDKKTLENFTDFINLFDDYVNQNEHLQTYNDKEIIKQTLEYYSGSIEINMDTKQLLPKIKDLVMKFESKFR